jgi:6-pyruvoyl tetrahydropterin synthase/QueD family protein
MKFQRVYRSTFEAGHFIEGHPKCGVQHGHSYHLNVYIDGDIDKWLDFADIKKSVDNYVQKELDHHFLGNISAEQIAKDIALKMEMAGYHGKLELMETDKFGVTLQF